MRPAVLLTFTLLAMAFTAAPAIAGESSITDVAPGAELDQVVIQRTLTPAEVVALGGAPDGALVSVEGEAIGDILKAGKGGSWLNILGDSVAVGLWAQDPALFTDVQRLGDYKTRGDILRVEGTYNAACDLHGGDRDVHLLRLTVISPGEPIERPVKWWKLFVGFALIAAAWGVRRFNAYRALSDDT